jgi:WD40 repeat protein
MRALGYCWRKKVIGIGLPVVIALCGALLAGLMLWNSLGFQSRATINTQNVCEKVIFAADGTLLLTVHGSMRETLQVGLWDVQTGRLLHMLFEGEKSDFNEIWPCFSPDSKQVALEQEGRPILVFDVATGKRIAEHAVKEFQRHKPGPIFLLGKVCVFDWNQNNFVDVTTGKAILPIPAQGRASFSPMTHGFLEMSFDGTARSRDYQTGQVVAKFRFPKNAVGGMFLSPDLRVLVLADPTANGMQIWSSATGTLTTLNIGNVGREVDLSADGSVVAVRRYSSKDQMPLDVQLHELPSTSPLVKWKADLVRFSPNGKTVAVRPGLPARTITIYDWPLQTPWEKIIGWSAVIGLVAGLISRHVIGLQK